MSLIASVPGAGLFVSFIPVNVAGLDPDPEFGAVEIGLVVVAVGCRPLLILSSDNRA